MFDDAPPPQLSIGFVPGQFATNVARMFHAIKTAATTEEAEEISLAFIEAIQQDENTVFAAMMDQALDEETREANVADHQRAMASIANFDRCRKALLEHLDNINFEDLIGRNGIGQLAEVEGDELPFDEVVDYAQLQSIRSAANLTLAEKEHRIDILEKDAKRRDLQQTMKCLNGLASSANAALETSERCLVDNSTSRATVNSIFLTVEDSLTTVYCNVVSGMARSFAASRRYSEQSANALDQIFSASRKLAALANREE